jgi:hypothetical protein
MTGATSITVRVPLKIRRRPGRKTVVMPVKEEAGDGTIPTRADPALVKALARAFRYQRLLDEGRYASITEMAAAERIDRGYLGRLLQMALLAPAIVEIIINAQTPSSWTLPRMMRPGPVAWGAQMAWVREAPEPTPHA